MGNCHTFSEQDVKIWETETCETEIGWDGVECMDYESALERCAGFKYDTCYAITNTTEGRRCREALEAQFSHWAGEYGDDARSFEVSSECATNQDCIVLIVVLSVVGFVLCVAAGFAYLFWRRTRALERLAAVGALGQAAAPLAGDARAVGNAGVVAALPDWLRRDMSHNFVSRSDVGIVGIYFLVVMMMVVGHARMDATTPSTPPWVELFYAGIVLLTIATPVLVCYCRVRARLFPRVAVAPTASAVGAELVPMAQAEAVVEVASEVAVADNHSKLPVG